MNEYWKPLDEELAERVMGWTLVKLSEEKWADYWPSWPRETLMRLAWMVVDPEDKICQVEAPPLTGEGGHWQPAWIPPFSTDLKEAMRILDKMRELGYRWLLNADTEGFHLRRVALVKMDLERDEKGYTCDRPLGWAKTLEELPLVICKAALQEIKTKSV